MLGPLFRARSRQPTVPVGPDLRDLQAATERSLVRVYGSAKSQQDIGAALAVCGDDFAPETPAFATRGVGRAEVAAQLAIFFRAFPDYRVELEGLAQGDALVAWGRAPLSLRGAIAGLAPTHKTVELGFSPAALAEALAELGVASAAA